MNPSWATTIRMIFVSGIIWLGPALVAQHYDTEWQASTGMMGTYLAGEFTLLMTTKKRE